MSGPASASAASAWAHRTSLRLRLRRIPSARVRLLSPIHRRSLQIHATPSSASPTVAHAEGSESSLLPASQPDARFEVLGAPYSLLSVDLSASQNLYTRRGTLVGLSGKAENTVSALSVLEPFRRAALGIPFLYQKISSTSPITALISTRSPLTSFTVIHLDGRVDWMVAQRAALLAWSGYALSVRPRLNTQMSMAHWGNTQLTGRGLVALIGKGQIYQVSVKAGEEYVVHPSNIVAYTITPTTPPQPYRFKSSTLRLQIPRLHLPLTQYLPSTPPALRALRESTVWKSLSRFLFTLRTWTRRSIWGDRLFLRFQGPATILLQSRGARVRDALSARDVDEIADAPAGAVVEGLKLNVQREGGGREDAAKPAEPAQTEQQAEPTEPTEQTKPVVKVAVKGPDGKMRIQEEVQKEL